MKKKKRIYKMAAFAVCMALLAQGWVTGKTGLSLPGSIAEAAAVVETAAAGQEPAASKLYARAAVLMDADSGRVLYEKDGHVHMPNASTTKIMTCILVIESNRLEETATASSYAASRPKVRLGVSEGEQFVVRDLLYSLMLESHNDSAVILAEHIGGSVEGFAAMMNEKAKELGCEDTYFITPNGLDAKDENGVHGTTARDLALILSYCLKNETFLEITRTANYSFSDVAGRHKYSCTNHNAFLGMMDGALTGKTGFTGNAGYCYVGALRRDDRTFVVALLACGWPNNKAYKWADTKALMNYALENYQYEDVFEHGKTLEAIPVEGARPEDGSLYQQIAVQPQIEENNLRILKNPSEEIQVVYDLPQTLSAPITAGQQLGTVSYYMDGELLAAYPISADKDVALLTSDYYFQYILKSFFL